MSDETKTQVNENVRELPTGVMSSLKAESTIRKLFERFNRESLDKIKDVFGQYSQEASKNIIEQTNAVVEKLDKKFSGLYGALVNKFLLKLETRVFGGEVAIQAMIEESAQRLFEIERAISGQTIGAPEDVAKQLADYTAEYDKAVVARGDAIQKRWADAREAAAKAAQEKMMQDAETKKAEDANVGKDQGSDVSSDSSQ